jgi:hypothetical protein
MRVPQTAVHFSGSTHAAPRWELPANAATAGECDKLFRKTGEW